MTDDLSGIPPAIAFTVFASKFARDQRGGGEAATLAALAAVIRSGHAPDKPSLPWIKLAGFSGIPNPDSKSRAASLRYDAGVEWISGVEGDYDAKPKADGSLMAIEEAAKLIERAGIEAVLFQTPSSTPQKPHWRILCPTWHQYRGDDLKATRARFLARVNGVLGGVLAGESFTLSQSYYFGGIEGKPPIKPIVIQGKRIDLLDAFDGGAVYKHGGNQPEAPRKTAAAPDGVIESTDDPDLIAEIRGQIAGAIQRDGIGETPTGARAFALVTWLLKLRVGDKIIDPEALQNLVAEEWRDVADDLVENALAAIGDERGSVDLDRIPETDGVIPRLWQALAARDATLMLSDDVAGHEMTGEDEFDELLEIKVPGRRPVLAGSEKGKAMLEKMIADAGGVAPEQKRFAFTRNGARTTAQKIKWLWTGWLALGKLHLLAGDKGAGKSTICFTLAAPITTGGDWPDGSPAPLGDVLIWSAEDDWEDTILPRLIVAGCDTERVHHLSGVPDGQGGTRPFDPSTDAKWLDAVFADIPNLKLIIVDPIVLAVAGDSHKNAEPRRGLQPLVGFAERRHIALIGITHFTKGTDGKSPVERVTGSLAFAAQARIVLAAAASEDGKQRRLVRVASNIGPSGNGFEYMLLQEPLRDERYDFSAQRIMWGSSLQGPAKDLLEDVRTRSARLGAAAFLLDMLKDGPANVTDLKRAAEANGHSWRTIERAKKELPYVEARKIGELEWGKPPRWQWVNNAASGGSP